MSFWLFLFYFALIFFPHEDSYCVYNHCFLFCEKLSSFTKTKKIVKEMCYISGLWLFSPLSSITWGQNIKKLKEILKCFQKQSAISHSRNTITSLLSLLIHQNIKLSQYVLAILSVYKFSKVVFKFLKTRIICLLYLAFDLHKN